MRNWRKMTWVILAWTVLIIVWIVVGVSSNADNCDNETADMRELCEAATDVGTGLGVTVVLIIGFFGFVTLSIIWFMTRPKPEPHVMYVSAPPGSYGPPPGAYGPPQRAATAPPPPRTSKPAGWYRDPSGRFDWRWFDGGWTDHVSNEGDEETYIDAVPR